MNIQYPNEIFIRESSISNASIAISQLRPHLAEWSRSRQNRPYLYLHVTIRPPHFQTFVFESTITDVHFALAEVSKHLKLDVDAHMIWEDHQWRIEEG